MKLIVASTMTAFVCSLLSLPTSLAGIADGFKKEIPSDAELSVLRRARALPHYNEPRGLQSGFEQSAMIIMEEFSYNVDRRDELGLGTKFVFTGIVAADEEVNGQRQNIGTASGSCTLTSEVNLNETLCMMYITIDTTEGAFGHGTFLATGQIDDVGGKLHVTGAEYDFNALSGGGVNLVFDTTGNPIFYVLIRLS